MKKFFAALFCIGIIFATGTSIYAKVIKDEQYYFNQGQDYERKNNRLGATEPYSKALEINPNFDKARIARAHIYYFYGQYDKALEDFNYFYNKTPEFGPAAFYDYRIGCKKQLNMNKEAFDDMYEVILVYGGQANILKDMFDFVQLHPELKTGLDPKTHPELMEKYKDKAKTLRDYAQMYKDKEGNITNNQYYDFFINIAKTMDPDIILDVEYPTELPRKAPENSQVIDSSIEVK